MDRSRLSTQKQHSHLQKTLVLEEIQMLQTLNLCVMHGMLASDSGLGKSDACDEVRDNIELPRAASRATPQTYEGTTTPRVVRKIDSS